jgi:hypothetical protein
MGKSVGVVLVLLVACTKSSSDVDAHCGDGIVTPGVNGTGEQTELGTISIHIDGL